MGKEAQSHKPKRFEGQRRRCTGCNRQKSIKSRFANGENNTCLECEGESNKETAKKTNREVKKKSRDLAWDNISNRFHTYGIDPRSDEAKLCKYLWSTFQQAGRAVATPPNYVFKGNDLEELYTFVQSRIDKPTDKWEPINFDSDVSYHNQHVNYFSH